MEPYVIEFELRAFEQLDQLALLACQEHNYGDKDQWFLEFRGGLRGLYARLLGIERHYLEVHDWVPRIWLPKETEYHLASILFNMDSALECLVFALNALGWAVNGKGFRDVTDSDALRKVCPRDIYGSNGDVIQNMHGEVFPTLQQTWRNEKELIGRICELHDVSKHRKMVFVGGRQRSDPPDGFFEQLGLKDDSTKRALVTPMAEIILKEDPKRPASHAASNDPPKRELLEDLVPQFVALIDASGLAATTDAKTNISMNEE